MKRIIIYFISLYITNFAFPQNKSIEKLIEEFKSCNWRRWDMALSQIVDYSNHPNEGPWIPKIKPEYNIPEIKDIIFEYVVVPAGKRCESIGPVSEGVDEFRILLLSVMGGLKEDRMLPYLLEELGSGTQISFVITGYGEKVIDPLITKLREGSWQAPWALGEMLRNKSIGYIAQGFIRKKIKDSMIDVLNLSNQKVSLLSKESKDFESIRSEEFSRRKKIVEALAKSEDPDVIPILEEISKSDEYEFIPIQKKPIMKGGKMFVPPVNPRAGQKIYPVREAAQKALEELKQKGVK